LAIGHTHIEARCRSPLFFEFFARGLEKLHCNAISVSESEESRTRARANLVITLDAYAASHRAITKLQSTGTLVHCVEIRSSKYLNNVVEQDHRRIKQRVRAMLGFKRLATAAIIITGIEFAEKIRKQQFKVGNLPGRTGSVPGIWAAVLAA
jgi:hypothetical protein